MRNLATIVLAVTFVASLNVQAQAKTRPATKATSVMGPNIYRVLDVPFGVRFKLKLEGHTDWWDLEAIIGASYYFLEGKLGVRAAADFSLHSFARGFGALFSLEGIYSPFGNERWLGFFAGIKAGILPDYYGESVTPVLFHAGPIFRAFPWGPHVHFEFRFSFFLGMENVPWSYFRPRKGAFVAGIGIEVLWVLAAMRKDKRSGRVVSLAMPGSHKDWELRRIEQLRRQMRYQQERHKLQLEAEKGKFKDTDKDGILDHVDKCPKHRGSIDYKGCPRFLDSDGDGIMDYEDKCPMVRGPKEHNGCLPPKYTLKEKGDYDGDGIMNWVDKCPFHAGSIENKGCPKGYTGKGTIKIQPVLPRQVPAQSRRKTSPKISRALLGLAIWYVKRKRGRSKRVLVRFLKYLLKRYRKKRQRKVTARWLYRNYRRYRRKINSNRDRRILKNFYQYLRRKRR